LRLPWKHDPLACTIVFFNEVLGEPAAAVEPGKCSLDDPAFGQNFETFGLVGAFDDIDLELRQHMGEGFLKFDLRMVVLSASTFSLLWLK
jgi:hypothetical protein